MAKSNTFQEIARRCGINPASVTRAMRDSWRVSEETKLRIYLMAREIGYRRAKIRSDKHLEFAVFHGKAAWEEGAPVVDTARFPMWHAIMRAVNRLGAIVKIYELNLRDGEWDFAQLPSHFKCDQIDAIVTTGCPGEQFLQFLDQVRMPMVVASNIEQAIHVDQVGFNFVRPARMAVKLLLERGKRRIGFVSPASSLPVNCSLLQGYTAAMQAEGCYDPGLVSLSDAHDDHEGALTDALLKRQPKLDALFASNPRVAVQAALAAALHGIPPPDGLEIITCQFEIRRDLRYRTHILLPDFEGLGQATVNRLLERRNNPDTPVSTTLLDCRVIPDPETIKSVK